jgi:uncharacterized repeat protein (TIGR01451 family)
MTMNVTAPALQLTKTMPPEALICDNIPVKLVVTNSGTGTARNVMIKDPLPAGLAAVGGATEWNVGNLGPGQSATREFMVKADKVGSYTNTANAMAEGGLTANSGSVTTAVKAPTLAIDKKCPGQLRQGQNAKFEIVVSNTGNAVAANTVVTDPIPAGATFVSATEGGTLQGNQVVWNLGAMQPGASRTLGLTLRGNAGTINNTASATATCAQAVSDGCSVNFVGVPDIGTGIEDFTGVRNIGDNHDFDFIVKNQGQIDLTNVKVSFKADAGLDFVSTNWPGGAQAAAGAQTVNIGTLKVGEQKVFKIVYKGSKVGQLVLRSETTSDQTAMVRNDEQVNYVD